MTTTQLHAAFNEFADQYDAATPAARAELLNAVDATDDAGKLYGELANFTKCKLLKANVIAKK